MKVCYGGGDNNESSTRVSGRRQDGGEKGPITGVRRSVVDITKLIDALNTSVTARPVDYRSDIAAFITTVITTV